MELKVEQKYKQTELGEIPEDWLGVQFEDVMTGFSSGQTPSRTRPDYFKGDIKWVTSGELNYNVITDTIEKITEEAVVNTGLKVVPKGTFLFAITGLEAAGTRGSCALLGVDATTNQSCMALYPKTNLLTEYLYHFYVRYGNELAFRYCQGTKQQSFTGGIVKILPINVPPTIEEQTAIATALSDTDALINGLEKLIAKKRNIKQGAMQELLRPKEGWEMKKLGEMGTIITGSTPSTAVADYWSGNIPWVTPTDIGDRKDIVVTERQITNRGLQSIRELPANTLLVTCIASIGKNAVLRKKGASNQQINAIIPRSNFDVEFVYYLMELNKSVLIGKAGITATLIISKKDFSEIEFSVPNVDVQRQTATILADMDAEIEALKRKLEKHKEIKQGMMQVLLTGKVRLTATATNKRTIELTQQPAKPSSAKGHNVQFNEAVLISVLAGRYGSNKYPLSRFRYTKFLYLFHRQVEGAANGFLKKAAGPYNPSNRYGGPEGIAVKNKYVQLVENKGYIAHDNIDEAKRYFGKWYHDDALIWLDKFRFYKNDQLELLTTVDMAVDDLRKAGKAVSVASVKAVIAGNKEWKPKLKKEFFNDIAIAGAIQESMLLFPN